MVTAWKGNNQESIQWSSHAAVGLNTRTERAFHFGSCGPRGLKEEQVKDVLPGKEPQHD